MPQISLYIDEATLKKVEEAASKQQVSISKWVAQQIRAKVEPNYPQGFESLFGSVSDDTFQRPARVEREADANREMF